jgi:hypothetical protein
VPPPGTAFAAPEVPWWHRQPPRRNQMPVILWLLGVPLVVIVLLMLFGVL